MTSNQPPLWRRAAAELLGTCLLVTIVVGSGIAAQQLSPAMLACSCCRTAPLRCWA